MLKLKIFTVCVIPKNPADSGDMAFKKPTITVLPADQIIISTPAGTPSLTTLLYNSIAGAKMPRHVIGTPEFRANIQRIAAPPIALLIKVAHAAPATPISGKPPLPKIMQ